MKKKRKLLWHLFPSYLLITLLSVAALTWYAAHVFNRFFVEQAVQNLTSRAFLLKRQFVPLLAPPDPTRIDALTKDLGISSGTRLTVVLPNGKVLGDSDRNPASMENHANRPELAAALSGGLGTSERFSTTLNRRMMYVAIPIEQNGAIIAALRTAFPLTAIDRQVNHMIVKIALGCLFIILVAAAISLAVSRQVTKPLEKMKLGAASFAAGDLSRKIPIPDYRETADLAKSLNVMAAQLDQRIQTIDRQRNEQQAVLFSMAEGVIALDEDARIISINQAAQKIFKKPSAEMKGRSVQEALRIPALIRFIENALTTEEGVAGDIVLHDQDERILFIRSTSLNDSQKHRIGILVVFNDVTELRRLENMRKDFAASVSHEIKTPLTAIKGFVETLRDGSVEDVESQKRFLGIIEKHVNRLTAIIEELMHLSKIESEGEKKGLHLETHTLNAVLQSAVGFCRETAKAKEISLVVQCDADIHVDMDPTLLEQAFFNLLDNAIHYSNPGGRVEARVERLGREIAVHIEDRGIGIEKRHLPRLFERFYRVDKARSRKLGGTGLGLAIVKHIVLAHGGRISVASTPGKGTTFTIHLPIH